MPDDDTRTYWQRGTALGVRCLPGQTTFAVHAVADAVTLVTVNPKTRELRRQVCERTSDDPTIWHSRLQSDLHSWRYWYELERGGTQLGSVVDPYATAIEKGVGVIEAGAWDERLHRERPPRPPLQPEDAVIYELHIRDFTRDPKSGVTAAHRGRYLGLAEHGTRLDGTAIPTGIDHLLELGVNVVQLMPVAAFATPHQRWHEWGYMPNDWFAPHPSYATGGQAFSPGLELATLVDTLHNAGLRVTLDVVFNHNAETDTLGVRSLAALDPTGYFRRWQDGTPANGSGCGNEFASESPFGRQLIRDACRYWVDRYNIDGFRFDLMGLIDQTTLDLIREDLDQVDPSLMMYGEAWAAGPSPEPVLSMGFQRGTRIGVFNDRFRDGLRGDLFDHAQGGALTTGDPTRFESAIRGGIGSNSDDFADAPAEVIQYAECHDDLTLVDRLMLSDPDGGESHALARSALAAIVLLLAPGIPFIHAGQEFGRSKAGVANTYDRGDDLNNIHWSNKQARHGLFRHYRRMVRIRAAHPMFRPRTASAAESTFQPIHTTRDTQTPKGVLGGLFRDQSGADAWARCLLLMNTRDKPVRCDIPEGQWLAASASSVLLDEDAPGYGDAVGPAVTIKPLGFVLAYEPADSASATAAS